MKISLSWILDHIKRTDSITKSVQDIVDRFIVHTAEIEDWQAYKLDLSQFYAVCLKDIQKETIIVASPETGQDVHLPYRDDAKKDEYFIAKFDGNQWFWATCQDWGAADKEGYLPAMTLTAEQAAGSWKETMLSEDYIIEVDNKSINHRPDLWSHRGIARELAQYFDTELLQEETFLYDAQIKEYSEKSTVGSCGTYTIDLQASEKSPRFAGWYTDQVTVKASFPWMAQRLLLVGARPINALVDLTNYVMFDVGQPMHAFDGQGFVDNHVIVREAEQDEELQLLDGKNLKLQAGDLVVADTKKPVALAGIMGGKQASSSEKTTTLFVESIACDPTVIRKTAQRVKARSEASMRFEKHLDPMQNIVALRRFMQLGLQTGVLHTVVEPIISVGKILMPPTCEVLHSYIEQRLGVTLESEEVKRILEGLEFQVAVIDQESDFEYHVTIPTRRSTKDIAIADDIVEEIGRIYGYNRIQPVLPQRVMESFSYDEVMKQRTIKNFLAYTMRMHEIRDYAFYDQDFLRRLQYTPKNALQVHNPVSENWTTLVTSLVPNILKAIEKNLHEQQSLHFFEWNAVWRKIKETTFEKQYVAGVWFEQKQRYDFYHYKALLQQFFASLHIPITWEKAHDVDPWFDAPETAELWCQDTKIGTAGMLDERFYKHLLQGTGFAFEFDAEFLTTWKQSDYKFIPWSKYQAVQHDISIMLPYTHTAHQVKNAILQAHHYIVDVQQVDYFMKPEWTESRSLTFRYILQHPEATLSKEEIDAVEQRVIEVLKQQGAEVRQ